ncbi:MAG: acetoin utilization protein AcuB [Acidobacteria bacterium]|jgi:CBS domain-containing membrane protein|nr:acetoin utilization protein AcuB [Acidobacteriota bacterium]HJN44581.1 CBS domain-containing protein [Vicinamibacterales bacterium]|tara:strand:+ start:278 stop:787 length:510 start_codon:yes stop_codon:yes gene_type:complete
MTVVKALMSWNLITLRQSYPLSLAADMMKASRVRHLPILDADSRLVGILSQRDLFHSALVRALGVGTLAKDKILQTTRIQDVMATEVLTTTPDASVAEAAALMMANKVGCLPVLEGNDLVGILTESDFVAAAAGDKGYILADADPELDRLDSQSEQEASGAHFTGVRSA